MSKPLLIDVAYDKSMSFVFVNPTYSKALAPTFDAPGWPEKLEYEAVYLQGDPKQNDLTDLFDFTELQKLEEKLMQQFREP